MKNQCKISFNVGSTNLFYDINNIKSTVKGKLSSPNIQIHDYFVNLKNKTLYLVSDKDHQCYWCTPQQLNKDLIEKYNETIKLKATEEENGSENEHASTDCSRKEFSILYKNKTRSVGIMLAVYNCGIICAYKELFSSESLTQVTAFLLETYEILTEAPKYLIYDNGCHLETFFKNKKVFISRRSFILKVIIYCFKIRLEKCQIVARNFHNQKC